MATFVSTNAYVKLGSTDFSDHVEEVTLDEGYDEVDFTNMGSSANKEFKAGLHEASIKIKFQDDYAASSINTFWQLNKGTAVAFVVQPTNSAPSATNPKYTGSVLLSKAPVVAGKVGDKAVKDVTWKVTGALTFSTS